MRSRLRKSPTQRGNDSANKHSPKGLSDVTFISMFEEQTLRKHRCDIGGKQKKAMLLKKW